MLGGPDRSGSEEVKGRGGLSQQARCVCWISCLIVDLRRTQSFRSQLFGYRHVQSCQGPN